MSEVLLEALMQLFALLTDLSQEEKSGKAKQVVRAYLEKQFNSEYAEQYWKQFESYLQEYHQADAVDNPKALEEQSHKNHQKIIDICNELNHEMEEESKVLLFVQLLDFLKKEEDIGSEENHLIDTLAKHMLIDADDYRNMKCFILDSAQRVENKEQVLLISGNINNKELGYKHLFNEKQKVLIWVLKIESTNTFIFRYSGERNLYLNGHRVKQDNAYAMATGSVIRTSLMRPVYYGQVVSSFLVESSKQRILYRAMDVSYKFNLGQTAIHPFSLLVRSGQFVGVLGGSGTGKSTLLNVLNGNLKRNGGIITINGYDISSDKEHLKGVIGYVPQDDLLIEELTVFENLYYSAKFCFSNYTKEQISELVNNALLDFDLEEAKNLVVGSPLKKILSGGQRKRLNIALELIREPSILFVDEPTSGLSSIDSEKVMSLLKRQTIKGRLVVVNIHQPSSDLYKLFDKLLVMDKGGRIIHNGNPMDAIVYFKKMGHYVNAEEPECLTCGNVKTDQPLRIIEARMVDPNGRLIRERKIKPSEWYSLYQENFEQKFIWKKSSKLNNKEALPPNNFEVPSRFKQFTNYFLRDALSKLKDGQYMLINFMEAPLLALILGFFTKYIDKATQTYVLADNVNLPSYLFMCVIVALFLGLNVSAEEIIKDRKLLQRESFLNLSRFSYLSSKIVLLFLISAVQTLTFVWVGNGMLQLDGMTFSYWVVLFSLAAFSNVLGLNISSGLNSVVSIYILIPLILVPQMLFSGVIVPFEKLHPSIVTERKVPLIGNIMPSRWGYEALAVNQFSANKYEKHFFECDKNISNSSYYIRDLLPLLGLHVTEAQNSLRHEKMPEAQKHWAILKNEVLHLEYVSNYTCPNVALYAKPNQEILNEVALYLNGLKRHYQQEYKLAVQKKDGVMLDLTKQLGTEETVWELKRNHYNKSLEQWVKNKASLSPLELWENRYNRKKDPIYRMPEFTNGHAHFYASYKIIGQWEIKTLWFNILIIWLFTFALFITLYLDVLRRILASFEMIKNRQRNKRLWSMST